VAVVEVEEEPPVGPHRGHHVQHLQLEARRREHRRRRLEVVHQRLEVVHQRLEVVHQRLEVVHQRLEVVHQRPEVVHQRPELHRLYRPVRRPGGQLAEAEVVAE
jgi:hypothetical protein